MIDVHAASASKNTIMFTASITAADARVSQAPFFLKQWGGVSKKKAGRLLEGRTWDEMPLAEYVPNQ